MLVRINTVRLIDESRSWQLAVMTNDLFYSKGTY